MNIPRHLFGLGLVLAIGLGLPGCNKQKAPESGSNAPATSEMAATVDDSVVTTKVKAALLADADVKSFDIKVETKSGDVQLNGVVDNQTQIDHAVEVARKVEGVKNVTNQLTIKQ